MREAIRLNPKALYFARLAKAGKFIPGDPLIDRLRALADGPLSPDDQALADFALGKAYDDTGRHEEAFRRFSLGNRRMRARIAYDEAAALRLIGSIAGVFTRSFLASRRDWGDPSAKPVFIAGLPRSGSTLIERMLAAHPQVVTLGESNDFAEARRDAWSAADLPPFPHLAEALDRDACRRLAARYLARLPESLRVINKLPGTFPYLGLIALVFPEARILYPRRDPMDSCLSCYFELFASGHPYAYDLGEMGRYWRSSDDLMAHWRRALPEGMFLDVDYQALVEAPEAGARRMLDHLGLPWDPACLDFAKAEGRVRTASASQVRQSIHRDSVGRWRRYGPWLGDLRAALNSV